MHEKEKKNRNENNPRKINCARESDRKKNFPFKETCNGK